MSQRELFTDSAALTARELEARLVEILAMAMEGDKYRPSLLTQKARAEYRRLYPLWLARK